METRRGGEGRTHHSLGDTIRRISIHVVNTRGLPGSIDLEVFGVSDSRAYLCAISCRHRDVLPTTCALHVQVALKG